MVIIKTSKKNCSLKRVKTAVKGYIIILLKGMLSIIQFELKLNHPLNQSELSL